MSQLIYLVRHGETVWNVDGRVQGHRDSPLTERGIGQARHAGEALAALIEGEPAFVLTHSPLGRVRHTTELILEAIGERIAEVRADERLTEVTWGRWDGMTRAEIVAAEPDLWAWRTADPWRNPPPGGESHERLCARATRWLHSVEKEPRLIVVGHGAFGQALRAVVLNLSPTGMAALDEPQDALFRLTAGTVARIPTS